MSLQKSFQEGDKNLGFIGAIKHCVMLPEGPLKTMDPG